MKVCVKSSNLCQGLYLFVEVEQKLNIIKIKHDQQRTMHQLLLRTSVKIFLGKIIEYKVYWVNDGGSQGTNNAWTTPDSWKDSVLKWRMKFCWIEEIITNGARGTNFLERKADDGMEGGQISHSLKDQEEDEGVIFLLGLAGTRDGGNQVKLGTIEPGEMQTGWLSPRVVKEAANDLTDLSISRSLTTHHQLWRSSAWCAHHFTQTHGYHQL